MGASRCGSAGDGRSALSSLGTPVFMVTGPQQCLQSHLHKRLEVIASLLLSAVLQGDKTETDTFTGNTAVTAKYFQAVADVGE